MKQKNACVTIRLISQSGIPMNQKIPQKKQAILKAALTLFNERGFDGTPTSLIAKEAGVATGTLFHYFKTKEELINSLYLSIKDDMLAELVKLIEKETTLEGKLERAFKDSIYIDLKNPEYYKFYSQFCYSPYITKLTKEQAMQRFEFLINLFKQAQQDGVLQTYSMEFIFEIIAGIYKATVEHLINNPEEDAQTYIDNAYEVICRGFGLK